MLLLEIDVRNVCTSISCDVACLTRSSILNRRAFIFLFPANQESRNCDLEGRPFFSLFGQKVGLRSQPAEWLLSPAVMNIEPAGIADLSFLSPLMRTPLISASELPKRCAPKGRST